MSAFVVSTTHIDALVRVTRNGPKDGASHWDTFRYFYPESGEGTWCEIDRTSLDAAEELGAMLIRFNIAAVRYRYRGNDPDSMIPEDADLPYRYPFNAPVLTAVEALKAINCYAYQVCDHPDWLASRAWAFCNALTDCLIRSLPGYEEAAWEVSDAQVTA